METIKCCYTFACYELILIL